MATLIEEPVLQGTGGDRGVVLAVVAMDDPSAPVLRYAQLVAAVDGRDLRVLVLRSRAGFSTDAALVAARRRVRNRVRALCDGYRGDGLDVDELVVPRRVVRDPALLWERVLRAARLRQAAAVVLPEHLRDAAPRSVPGMTVLTVLGRPGPR